MKHLCADYEHKLNEVFKISTLTDDPDTHPRFFCHSCKIVLLKASNAEKLYQHRTTVFEGWCKHVDGSCTVCQHYQSFQQRGRPKKVKHTAGRPPIISPRYCIDHVHAVAPPPLAPLTEVINVCVQHPHVALPELTCLICCEVLRCPVELVTCRSVVCAKCLCSWLQHSDKLACPCCYNHHLNEYSTGIRSASSLTLHLLGELCVICERCQGHVQLESYNDHVRSNCTTHSRQVSSATSVVDVLRQPLTSPLTPVEQKLQTSLARRSLSDSPDEVLQMKTGGRVRHKYTRNIIHIHKLRNTHTITANDLCTGESVSSANWEGSAENNSETIPFPR